MDFIYPLVYIKLLPTVRLLLLLQQSVLTCGKIFSFKIIYTLWSHFPERKTRITMEGGNFYHVGPGFRRDVSHFFELRKLKITRSLKNLVTEDRGKSEGPFTKRPHSRASTNPSTPSLTECLKKTDRFSKVEGVG